MEEHYTFDYAIPATGKVISLTTNSDAESGDEGCRKDRVLHLMNLKSYDHELRSRAVSFESGREPLLLEHDVNGLNDAYLRICLAVDDHLMLELF